MIAALLLLAQLSAAKPLALRVEVTPEPFTLGEALTLRLEVEHDARDVYTLPEVKLEPLRLSGPAQVQRAPKGAHAQTTFVLRLVDVATLEPKLPDLTLRVDGPDGPRQVVVGGRPLRLRRLVAEEGAPDAAHAHHGPKPPVPVKVRSLLWLGLLASLAAAAAAVTGLRAFLKRRARGVELPRAAPLAPEDEAVQRLVALREEGRFSRQTIFAVSEIVRAFLGRRFAFDALDRTTGELLHDLRARAAPGLDLAGLERDLRWQDLVKFARVEPTDPEAREAIDRAIALVNRTRPPRTEAA